MSARKTLLTLWNVLSFFVTYADIEEWSHADEPPDPTHVLDRWLLAQVDDAVADVTASLHGFDSFAAASRIDALVDDISNWYVRRSRPRFWTASDPTAFASLHLALTTTVKLLAPFCPFLADEIYRTLTGDESVHLADWPEPGGYADAELVARVDAVRRIVSIGRSARSTAGLKVRLPLRRARLVVPGLSLDDGLEAEIMDELNVRHLEVVEGLADFMSWEVVPNFRVLGPRLGADVETVKRLLADADGNEIRHALEHDGTVTVGGFELGADDVEVRATGHHSFALAEDGNWAVALDLDVDEELEREGLARDLVRSLNDLRKEAGFEIADRVELVIGGDDDIEAVLDVHGDRIAEEVLAVSLVRGGGDRELSVDGRNVRVSISKTSH